MRKLELDAGPGIAITSPVASNRTERIPSVLMPSVSSKVVKPLRLMRVTPALPVPTHRFPSRSATSDQRLSCARPLRRV